ncbi:MAG TPA: hypothetical protein VGQ90_10365, partial [Stellaceae bacterium]|nr:hypothetical protein [Stellaceae bacterium]
MPAGRDQRAGRCRRRGRDISSGRFPREAGTCASIGSCRARRRRDINGALMPILFLIVFVDLVG